MKKIIFLDHDGVICLDNNFGSRMKKSGYVGLNSSIESRFDNFDKKAVSVLNDILQKTEADIVVSSDWRRWATIEEMGQYYELQGIIRKPIGFTRSLATFDPGESSRCNWRCQLERARALEIRKWIEENGADRWVAVDDLNMGIFVEGKGGLTEFGLENFILTPRSSEGIKQCDLANKIISILNEA
jgi:hypothetical protein